MQFEDTPSLGSLANLGEAIVWWYEGNVFRGPIDAAASRGHRVYLLFDEVQNLQGWSAQLKTLVDHVDVATLVTGSSALRIARGHDNLAGRVSKIELGPLRLAVGDQQPALRVNHERHGQQFTPTRPPAPVRISEHVAGAGNGRSRRLPHDPCSDGRRPDVPVRTAQAAPARSATAATTRSGSQA